ncbi:MAG: ATP-dependent Clp protease adaptor ClpS [Candidatus Altiarchaeales archaeon]|nr:ATP-dependent Clp protease adaptor ClpS [Candidatus Altiarchaeales archaeon]
MYTRRKHLKKCRWATPSMKMNSISQEMTSMNSEQTTTEVTTDINLGDPYNVVLFNDESHSMDEVANQIVKAIGGSIDNAVKIMMEAHEKGRAIVITTHKERAEHVASILEEIQLGVKVEPA